jgi:hypothetical protein
MGFWIFLGLVVVASTYEDIEEKKSRAKLLLAALEKGQELDPKLLEQLFPGSGGDTKPMNPRNMRIAATVVASIGVGLGLLALALKQIDTDKFWVCLGLGGLALATSVGIYIASRMLAAWQTDSLSIPRS